MIGLQNIVFVDPAVPCEAMPSWSLIAMLVQRKPFRVSDSYNQSKFSCFLVSIVWDGGGKLAFIGELTGYNRNNKHSLQQQIFENASHRGGKTPVTSTLEEFPTRDVASASFIEYFYIYLIYLYHIIILHIFMKCSM